MTELEAQVGTRVVSLRAFSCVPAGTEGVIDQDYGSGIMVAWDLPDQRLPDGYLEYDGRPAFASDILRDGFDKATELHMLGLAGDAGLRLQALGMGRTVQGQPRGEDE